MKKILLFLIAIFAVAGNLHAVAYSFVAKGNDGVTYTLQVDPFWNTVIISDAKGHFTVKAREMTAFMNSSHEDVTINLETSDLKKYDHYYVWNTKRNRQEKIDQIRISNGFLRENPKIELTPFSCSVILDLVPVDNDSFSASFNALIDDLIKKRKGIDNNGRPIDPNKNNSYRVSSNSTPTTNSNKTIEKKTDISPMPAKPKEVVVPIQQKKDTDLTISTFLNRPMGVMDGLFVKMLTYDGVLSWIHKNRPAWTPRAYSSPKALEMNRYLGYDRTWAGQIPTVQCIFNEKDRLSQYLVRFDFPSSTYSKKQIDLFYEDLKACVIMEVNLQPAANGNYLIGTKDNKTVSLSRESTDSNDSIFLMVSL